MVSPRGTTNGNDRGSTTSRRNRRAWLMLNWVSDLPGFVRCYRCGCLLHNPDDPEMLRLGVDSKPLSVDRITPGCQGGTYRRTSIRPACLRCNSSTGGRTRGKA